MAYVYRHIRLDKNIPFYIGIGVGYRANQKHKRSLYWQRIVSKYGYRIEIIMDDLTWEQAVEKEKEFIKLYGRKDKKQGPLANLTDGGEGMLGFIVSEKTKNKLSADRKGICPRPAGWKMPQSGIEKMRISNKGHKRCVGRILSQETKDKIRKALIGQPPTTGRAIIKYDMTGNFVSEYKSANEVERKMNMTASNITAACRKRMRGKYLYNKYIWRYKDDIVSEYGCVVNKIPITASETPVVRSIESRRKGAKLNIEMAEEIRCSKLSGNVLAVKYGVTSTCIYAIKNGETWVK